ncbi:YtkA-like protein [Thermosporothrix hazakensis]|jgi:hypothetical protein|uniref:YtkA-like protein n=1 Tax=Thermosporothrix hazakensis TaxID=644383 RepID=A0A326U3G0_THEHA|nr:FixH family protein [Thermosporothrix hazakensis]PZW26600.1 YtkA-like protein [Thermosporothrix hazakensis]GCE47699.1 hypothetical protein KTH_25680 [Thermosporothrix hazakensis]
MQRKRKLLILLAGVLFLAVMSGFGAWVSNMETPHTTAPSPAVQEAHSGPYLIRLQVDPNPPTPSREATLALQVLREQQPITNARITLETTMQAMDMGTTPLEAQSQNNNLYLAHFRFSMSGPWLLHTRIAISGEQPITVTFEITAQ